MSGAPRESAGKVRHGSHGREASKPWGGPRESNPDRYLPHAAPRRSMPRRVSARAFTLAFGTLIAACSNAVEPVTSDSSLRIANATTGSIDVWIDGRQRALGLSMNALSYVLSVPAGSHQVRLGDPIAGMTELLIETTPDEPQTIVAYPTNVG